MRPTRLCIVACLVLAATTTHARPPLAPEDPDAVAWRPEWRKMQAWEYALTLGMGLGVAGILVFDDPPTSGGTRGVLFDDAFRSLLRADTRGGRDTARLIGDIGYRTMLIYPTLDAMLAWAVHGDGEYAWQMFAMTAEVTAFAGLAAFVTDHYVPRPRPSQAECAKNPDYEVFCNEPDEYQSFISGHTAIASAGAGVTCAHHLNAPLYGGGAGDIAACVGTIGLALTTGIARIVNDRHYATDVVVAWVVGGAAGFLWPALYHYTDDDDALATWMVLPFGSADSIGAQATGTW